MYHSITFTRPITDGTASSAHAYTTDEAITLGRPELANTLKGYNTWYDWHLIPTSRPTIAHPTVKTNYVTIPGRQGSIDLTEYACKKPIYEDRTGSFVFYAIPDYYVNTENVKNAILATIHGREMWLCFEDDPGYYYTGRFTVKDWKNEAARPSLTIAYVLNPYKMEITSSTTPKRVIGIP